VGPHFLPSTNQQPTAKPNTTGWSHALQVGRRGGTCSPTFRARSPGASGTEISADLSERSLRVIGAPALTRRGDPLANMPPRAGRNAAAALATIKRTAPDPRP